MKRQVEIRREVILGYLHVLGNQKVLERLSPQDQKLGHDNLIGSLVVLTEYLEKRPQPHLRCVLEVIKYRETLNGFLQQHPQLTRATTECAEVVYNWLCQEDNWNSRMRESLDEFDNQMRNIFKGYGTEEEARFLSNFDKEFDGERL